MTARKETPQPKGRPTEYDPSFCETVIQLCESGATDLEVADGLGVHLATIYRWKSRYPEFCEAVKVGKAAADDRVERSLYARAVGYEHEATKIFNNNGEIIYAPYVEHYPPDTGAAIMWLKNRRPDKWRDKQEHKIDATIEVTSARDIIHQKLDALRERLESGVVLK